MILIVFGVSCFRSFVTLFFFCCEFCGCKDFNKSQIYRSTQYIRRLVHSWKNVLILYRCAQYKRSLEKCAIGMLSVLLCLTFCLDGNKMSERKICMLVVVFRKFDVCLVAHRCFASICARIKRVFSLNKISLGCD